MITILMPVYNGIEYIQESVESIINQTYTDWELLIGINGHLPNSSVYQTTIKFIQTISPSIQNKIHIFEFPKEIIGKSATLNEMVKYAKFDWIALLDVDDIWHIQKLAFQSYFLEKYDVIGSKCSYFGEVNNIIPNIPTEDITYFNMSIMNPIINSSVILRKSLCYWNIEIDSLEDYDLWIRLQKMGKTFYNLQHVLVKHRIHSDSAFNSKYSPDKICKLLQSHYTHECIQNV